MIRSFHDNLAEGWILVKTTVDGAYIMAMAGLFSTVLGLIAWMIKRSFDSAQKNLGNSIRDALDIMRVSTDGLKTTMVDLNNTIKDEQKERIQSQKEIAVMGRDIVSNREFIGRVDDKLDRHILKSGD